jgi:hypothetical protein
MQNLFDVHTFENCLERIHVINDKTVSQWGKMNAAQMLHHCQKPLEVVLQKKDHGLKSNLLAQWFFKRMMYNDKPWSKGMQTPKCFKVETAKEMDEEKKVLINLLQEFFAQRKREKWPKHPVFGKFTPEQVGKMQFKHLDHHLKQFGI